MFYYGSNLSFWKICSPEQHASSAVRVNDFTFRVSPADLFIRKDRRHDDDREDRDDARRSADNLDDRPELLVS